MNIIYVIGTVVAYFLAFGLNCLVDVIAEHPIKLAYNFEMALTAPIVYIICVLIQKK